MSDTETFLEASEAKQVAILVLSQQSEREIAHQLNLPRHRVERIKKSEEFEKALKELAEEKTSILLYRWKKRLESAESAAWEAFMHNLKNKKNMEAVKEYLNMIGFNVKQKDQADAGPAINIIMPSNEAPQQVIEVKTDNESGAV